MKPFFSGIFIHLSFFSLAVFFLLLLGCASGGGNLWPVHYSKPIVDETDREAVHREILYPFIETQRSPERRYVVLRPLANLESMPEEGFWRAQFLWPFGLISLREGEGRLYRLWPVFQQSSTISSSGAESSHGMIFPLVFWGNKPEKGHYAAILPLGGRTYGLLGDEFSWVLFPLYSYYESGDYRRHDILWPFFSIGGTPDGRKTTRRMWPIYVRKEEEASVHNYLFWPFLRWGHEKWETVAGDPRRRDYVAFHPFYSRMTMRDEDEVDVSGQRQILLYTRRWDRRWEEGQKQWSAFFSLIRRVDTTERDEWRFFPVFWRRILSPPAEGEEDRSIVHHRLFWPLIWHTQDLSLPDKERSYSVFAPFLWHYRTHHVEEDVTEKSTTFWPFITIDHGLEDDYGIYMLSHGWGDPDSGYKRNYRPFFEFFRFRARPDDSRETRLLWRLYHHRRCPQERYLSVPFLFTYDASTDDEDELRSSLSFFAGLVEYEWGADGQGLNLFWR